MNIGEFYNVYEVEQREGYAVGTWKSRLSLLKNHFLPDYGKEDLRSITSADINRICDDMRYMGLANNTVFGMRCALSSYFALATNGGYTDSNPVDNSEVVHRD